CTSCNACVCQGFLLAWVRHNSEHGHMGQEFLSSYDQLSRGIGWHRVSNQHRIEVLDRKHRQSLISTCDRTHHVALSFEEGLPESEQLTVVADGENRS